MNSSNIFLILYFIKNINLILKLFKSLESVRYFTFIQQGCIKLVKSEGQVKSSHLYLYSAFNNTNCDKATAQYQNGKIVSIM